MVDPLGHCQVAADQFHGDLIAGRVLRPILLSVELFNGTFAHGPIEGACVRACVCACARCVRACVRACVRVCMRACTLDSTDVVRVRVRACVCACFLVATRWS